MNDKTEELREIFTSVTDGEETVTESQEDTRGSLEKSDQTVDERLERVIAQMDERYGFETPLSETELEEVAKAYYDGQRDEEIADEFDTDAEVVFEARCALHLVDDADADEIDLVAIRDREEDDETLAAEYDVDPDTIRQYRRVAEAKAESRAANDRYRDEFDSLLADSDLASRMATDVREDGLEDATEGMETDVSF